MYEIKNMKSILKKIINFIQIEKKCKIFFIKKQNKVIKNARLRLFRKDQEKEKTLQRRKTRKNLRHPQSETSQKVSHVYEINISFSVFS